MKNLGIVLVGAFFGIVLTKGEIVSWFRIYEMFQFQSFHMYGIIGSAVVFGVVLFQIIKRRQLNDIYGQPITFSPKPKNYKANLIGGTIFGLGWAMTGACPGPMFSLIGSGMGIMAIVFFSALLGTFAYGMIQHKLPK